MCIGCDLVVKKSKIYESGPARIPGDYRDPPSVFAEIARRFPDRFMWGTDNPGYTFISNIPNRPGGEVHRLALWSTMEREKELLRDVKGKPQAQSRLRKRIGFYRRLKVGRDRRARRAKGRARRARRSAYLNSRPIPSGGKLVEQRAAGLRAAPDSGPIGPRIFRENARCGRNLRCGE